MIFLPAIDLKDGQCVRLLKGDFNQTTVFNDNPASQAKAFERAGCQWIHVVRDRATIDMWLEKGVSRVGLGTIALSNPNLVREACRVYPNRIAVGIDTKAGKVALEGWSKTSQISALELAKKYEDAGVSVIIYTDIDRDGAMKGPNIEATLQLANTISIPVIMSGGVSSMEDLRTLKIMGNGVLDGVICGRAIYDNRIDPGEAIALLDGPP